VTERKFEMGYKEVKRFKRVLHIRTVEREITQGELAGQLREEKEIMGRLGEIESKRDSAMADFCAGGRDAVSPRQFWFERQNIDIIEHSLSDGRQELDVCRDKIEETKAELIERHQNVQLMEKYVGRLKDRADMEIIAGEQKNLDDITSMRYLNNMGHEA
jgi:flagellar export protein FliJ